MIITNPVKLFSLSVTASSANTRNHPLEIKHSNANPLKIKTHCLILPVVNQKKLIGTAAEIDKASDKFISGILKSGSLGSATGTSIMLHSVPNIAAQRVLLVNTGADVPMTAIDFENMCRRVVIAVSLSLIHI